MSFLIFIFVGILTLCQIGRNPASGEWSFFYSKFKKWEVWKLWLINND